ncbi:chaperone NapD [Cellvibrio sp. NN19]|uniref:chaperone NapD n=1 Tax=Cellvibrio chitinivorans TaxID=3102792 RepID=UPI002B407C96|nr:chaperone NapD [Cellvibrio sp. NN19]
MNQQFIPAQEISSPPQQLHIASLIAHVRPEYVAQVRHWLSDESNTIIRAEIHAETAQGKMVIVTESEAEKAIADFLDALRNQPGVLNAALVYHEYLSGSDLADEYSPAITAREEQPL